MNNEEYEQEERKIAAARRDADRKKMREDISAKKSQINAMKQE